MVGRDDFSAASACLSLDEGKKLHDSAPCSRATAEIPAAQYPQLSPTNTTYYLCVRVYTVDLRHWHKIVCEYVQVIIFDCVAIVFSGTHVLYTTCLPIERERCLLYR